MLKPTAIRQLIAFTCASILTTTSPQAMAAAFQIWEQDAASVGNYHAGRAASANDATTAYYNPAGMIRIQNQQFVLGDVGILTNGKYRGTVATNTYLGGAAQSVTAQNGSFTQAPNFHYVAPITPTIAFGLSLAVPFGLNAVYGRNTALRYDSVKAELQVIDLSPSLGFNLTKKLSVGFGMNVQRMNAQFDSTLTQGAGTDTSAVSKGWDIAYGYHLGALYQFMPSTRVGIAYQSQVAHHIRGTSKLIGPVANALNGGPVVSTEANANFTLPPFTTLSAYHQLNQKWAVMGSVIYTQWSFLQKTISLKDQSGVSAGGAGVNMLTVNLPQYYHNTWNLSVGADYNVTDQFTLRSGIGFDQSPTNNKYRNVQIPDSDHYAIAFGGHFQATKTFGIDLGWTHLFIANANISPPPQVIGSQVSTTNGSVKSSADIFGAQFTWDLV